MDHERHGIESPVFKEVDQITFELWSLPYEGSPAQQVAYGIPTLEEAWVLLEQLGGDTMFKVRDSSGAWHYRARSSGSAEQDFSANPAHPSYYKTGGAAARPPMGTAIASSNLWKSNAWKAARSFYRGIALILGNMVIWFGLFGQNEGLGPIAGLIAGIATITYLIWKADRRQKAAKAAGAV